MLVFGGWAQYMEGDDPCQRRKLSLSLEMLVKCPVALTRW